MNAVLSVFDLDHTLLKVNSSFRFGLFLYEKGLFGLVDLLRCLSYYLRHKYFGLSIQELHQKSFSVLFKGKSPQLIDMYSRAFIKEKLDQMINPSILDLLREANKSGGYCAIFSSSPAFLVGPIADKWGVYFWEATTYETDNYGNFKKIKCILEGEEKAHALNELAGRLQIKQANTVVYSDSHLDLPVLKMAGKAIGVFPDRSLKKICRANGWQIIEE